jgi:flagellar basal-body rod protein FlgC
MTDAISIALSGLTAQKQRLAATASNIANVSTAGAVPGANTSSPAAPTVYKPLKTTFVSQEGGGVRADVRADENAYSLVYDPQSAYANSDGMIAVPNVDLATEVVNATITETVFKANLSVIRTQDEMLGELLDTLA